MLGKWHTAVAVLLLVYHVQSIKSLDTVLQLDNGDAFVFVAGPAVDATANLSSSLAGRNDSQGVSITIRSPVPSEMNETQLWSPAVQLNSSDDYTFLFWAYSFPAGRLNASVLDPQNRTIAIASIFMVADWSQHNITFSAETQGEYRLLLSGIAYGYNIPKGAYSMVNFDEFELMAGQIAAEVYTPPPRAPNPGRGGGPQGREAMQRESEERTGHSPRETQRDNDRDSSISNGSSTVPGSDSEGSAGRGGTGSNTEGGPTPGTAPLQLTVTPLTVPTAPPTIDTAPVLGTVVNMQYVNSQTSNVPSQQQTVYQTRSAEQQTGTIVIPSTSANMLPSLTQLQTGPADKVAPSLEGTAGATGVTGGALGPTVTLAQPNLVQDSTPASTAQVPMLPLMPGPPVNSNLPGAAAPVASPQTPAEGVVFGNITKTFTFDNDNVVDVVDTSTSMWVWVKEDAAMATWSAPDAAAAYSGVGGLLVNVSEPGINNYDVQVQSPDLWLEAGQTYYVRFYARATSDMLVRLDLLLRDGFEFQTGIDLALSPTWNLFNLSAVTASQTGVHFYGINLGLVQGIVMFDSFQFGPSDPVIASALAPAPMRDAAVAAPATAPTGSWAPALAPVPLPSLQLVAPPVGQPLPVVITGQVNAQDPQGLGASQGPV